jgi:dihydrofolate reductase
MRKVILGLGISLDGYIARPDGSVDFLTMDPDYDMAAFFSKVDTWLLGRKTLEDAVRMGGGKFDSGGLHCIVFSRTHAPGPQTGFEYTNKSPSDVVRELRHKPGKDIWLGGGGELIRDFLNEDLVDRIELGIVPVLIGAGRPLFPPGYPELKFKLVDSRAYPKTGLLAISYERVTRE